MPGMSRQPVAVLHQLVGENDSLLEAAAAERGIDQARDFLLLERPVEDGKRQSLGQNFGKQRATGGRLVTGDFLLPAVLAVLLVFLDARRDLGVQVEFAGLHGASDFGQIRENHPFALGIDTFARRIVETENDILRRNDDRLAVGRRQHVVRRQHQRAAFHLRFERQRNVHGHLVAVEVGVERRANQRVQLDRLAFDQRRLKRLDPQAVQRRRTVEHDRMFADHLFEDVPHHRFLHFNHLLGLLDGRRQAHDFEAVEDERLEQLKRHQLG